ncbi:hypothetical protein JTB14_030662 [Gonioctena quinquepunctata]|nr:hypothetical protein JTB14_030662 [Gonioctena quinquepunctata]
MFDEKKEEDWNDVMYADQQQPENKWLEIKRKTKKRTYINKNLQEIQLRPAPLRGTVESGNILLKVAKRASTIFITGLDPATKPEVVIEHLKQNNLGENSTCEKMRTKKDRMVSSFKLTVPQQLKNQIMAPELWPNGTMINHFLNLQRRLPHKNVQTRPT